MQASGKETRAEGSLKLVHTVLLVFTLLPFRSYHSLLVTLLHAPSELHPPRVDIDILILLVRARSNTRARSRSTTLLLLQISGPERRACCRGEGEDWAEEGDEVECDGGDAEAAHEKG